MPGDIAPFPQYAFMAWCSVKKRTGTTLPFIFTRILLILTTYSTMTAGN
jgi:hypothetical protein